MELSRQEHWCGLPFPSWGGFPVQGSNLGLLHCMQILYRLSHQGSQVIPTINSIQYLVYIHFSLIILKTYICSCFFSNQDAIKSHIPHLIALSQVSSNLTVVLLMRQALGPGALGRPRGSGWRGRWEGGSGWGTHVNLWLFHFNVWQNPLQIKK